MISIGKLTSVEQAVRYLREAVAHQQLEYYTARGESPGRWNGAGAEVLGLRGEVVDTDFAAVLSGTHPRTGEDLGKHWRTQTVVAFDVAVSAPKDVSILYALGDERMRATILRIHGVGVQAAAEYLQANAGWARQYNPKTRTAGAVRAKLIMPEFVHRTARPVTDPSTGRVTVDPQLHTHVTVPTWVQRPDGSWSQLYSEALYQHAAAAGAIAQAEWRDRLVRELGISTVVDGKGCFSIVGITDAQRREFSRRTQQIEALERQLGIDSPYGHKLAVVSTRESKNEVAPTEDLFAQWRERAADVGLDATSIQTLLAREPTALLAREPTALQPRRLDVERSTELLGERGLTAQYATFTRRDVIRSVAAHAPLGMSRAQLEATADSILADREAVQPLVPHRLEGERDADAIARWVDTGHELRYTTPEMLAIERSMIATAQQRSAAAVGVADGRETAAAIAARPTLTAGQRAMVRTVCQSPAGVVVVEGAAGVGKTFALDVCREAFEATGIQIVGCALAGKAADVLESGADIPTWTVTGMLHELQVDHLPPGGVLVVDEAGMIGDRELAELVSLAARDNAKLVVVGDPSQLQPIGAGAPMRTLGEHIGRVLVTENVRQKEPWERAALQLVRDGEARAAYDLYVSHGRIHIAESMPERRAEVVAEHARLEDRGVDAVILAQRRDEVAALNELARAKAVESERVHGPALTVDGREYQAGDRVLCLTNDRANGVSNGTRAIVTAVDVERQTLTVEREDHRQVVIDTTRYDAIDRGYAMTVHKAQGMTAEVALVVGSDGATREWTYTAMSRGTEATHYYAVAQPPERDRLGVSHMPAPTQPAEERIVHSWERSLQKESALDYPERYREADRDHTVSAPDVYAPATEAQRAALADLGAPEPDEHTTRLEAALAIERWSEQAAGTGLGQWLRETDAAEHRLDQLISDDSGVRPDRAELLHSSRGINPGDFQAAKALLDPYHALLDGEALKPTIGPGLAP
ncbi:MAG: MobF family relaxase [Candidatus Dormibacteria bacterium]